MEPKAPPGSHVQYEVEIAVVLDVGHDGKPVRPDVFKIIDTDCSGDLSETEVHQHFAWIRRAPPPDLFRKQDPNRDGRISWHEFTGPKGSRPKDEL